MNPIAAGAPLSGLHIQAGPFARDLRSRSEAVWVSLHAHPFLRHVADGSLPLANFRFFIEQDLLFLPDYARCIASGVVKSADEAELRFFAAEMNATIDSELPHNRLLLDRLVSLGAESRAPASVMAPATLGYTSFLLAVGARGGPLEIMTALLPCIWSYFDLAARIGKVRSDHPVYSEWVGFYLIDENRQLLQRVLDEFEVSAQRVAPSPVMQDRLAEIFQASCRWELAFWEMAYRLQTWPDSAAPVAP
jgi:thiaminase/transcriptional activator TenA